METISAPSDHRTAKTGKAATKSPQESTTSVAHIAPPPMPDKPTPGADAPGPATVSNRAVYSATEPKAAGFPPAAPSAPVEPTPAEPSPKASSPGPISAGGSHLDTYPHQTYPQMEGVSSSPDHGAATVRPAIGTAYARSKTEIPLNQSRSLAPHPVAPAPYAAQTVKAESAGSFAPQRPDGGPPHPSPGWEIGTVPLAAAPTSSETQLPGQALGISDGSLPPYSATHLARALKRAADQGSPSAMSATPLATRPESLSQPATVTTAGPTPLSQSLPNQVEQMTVPVDAPPKATATQPRLITSHHVEIPATVSNGATAEIVENLDAPASGLSQSDQGLSVAASPQRISPAATALAESHAPLPPALAARGERQISDPLALTPSTSVPDAAQPLPASALAAVAPRATTTEASPKAAQEERVLALPETGPSVPMGAGPSFSTAPLSAPSHAPQQGSGAPPAPQMHQIAQQIAHGLPSSTEQTTELRLSPHELGHLRLTLTSESGQMHVTIHAERADTLDLLRRHTTDLAADFLALGYQDTGFTFGQWAQDNRPAEGPRPEPAEPQVAAAHAPAASPLRPAADGLDLRL
ncbi:hypothetical protein FGG78_22075 [Thioclava sp. BHET1]|nr:hypothetical protein FGG78_22075 [Thioclava sp. BHET1]